MIYVYGGQPFLEGMVKEIAKRKPGMMSLVTLGITSATMYGVLEFALGEKPSMSGEVALLALVMLAGHWAEMRYSARASRALEELASLLPSQAHLIVDGDVP